MSDPRKTFICIKCGTEINDMFRTHGKDSQCEHCIKIEMGEKIRDTKLKDIAGSLLKIKVADDLTKAMNSKITEEITALLNNKGDKI